MKKSGNSNRYRLSAGNDDRYHQGKKYIHTFVAISNNTDKTWYQVLEENNLHPEESVKRSLKPKVIWSPVEERYPHIRNPIIFVLIHMTKVKKFTDITSLLLQDEHCSSI